MGLPCVGGRSLLCVPPVKQWSPDTMTQSLELTLTSSQTAGNYKVQPWWRGGRPGQCGEGTVGPGPRRKPGRWEWEPECFDRGKGEKIKMINVVVGRLVSWNRLGGFWSQWSVKKKVRILWRIGIVMWRGRKCEGRARAVLEHVTQTSLCEACRALFSSFHLESSSVLLHTALSFEDVQQNRITGTQGRYQVSNLTSYKALFSVH